MSDFLIVVGATLLPLFRLLALSFACGYCFPNEKIRLLTKQMVL
jgi:hypothetical protein